MQMQTTMQHMTFKKTLTDILFHQWRMTGVGLHHRSKKDFHRALEGDLHLGTQSSRIAVPSRLPMLQC
jgi:hypothetical protein